MPGARRSTAAAAAVGLMLLAVPTGPAAAQQPVGPKACTSASEESPVQVDVTTLLPSAPTTEDETLQLRGVLTNCGSEPLTGLTVRLARGNRLITRRALADATDEPVVGDLRLPPVEAELTDLAPGQATRFDLRARVGDLQLGRANGVFPLAVQARARYDGTARAPVGLAATFLPWFPDGPIAPTRVAWLLPLVDQPRRAPGEVLLDDQLDSLLAMTPERRGRLGEMLLAGVEGGKGECEQVAAPLPGLEPGEPASLDPADPAGCRGEDVPVTWGLDPDLLFSVEAMVRPYTVREGSRDVPHGASANAESWLVAMRAEARTSDVIALPYGDPDVVALAGADSGLGDDIEQLRKLGVTTTRLLLGSDPLTSLAWPPPGPAGSVVDALAGDPTNPTALVLDAAGFPARTQDLDRTPSARTELVTSSAGRVTGLVVDAGLSALVAPDPSAAGWQGPRLAEQRWVAELAMLTAERPSTSRTVVVAPDRQARVVPSVLAGALKDTGRFGWACPVPLADVAAGREQCAALPAGSGAIDTQAPVAAEARGVPLQRSDSADRLSPGFVARLAAVRGASDQFTDDVLIGGSEQAATTKKRLLRARGRAESSAWRDDPRDGERMLELLQRDVERLRAQIRLLSAPALLTGRSGIVRLTVENRHAQPVNIGVRLDENSAARLVSDDTAVTEVPGESARQISIRVTARTSGRFEARAVLVDVDGRPFGSTVTFRVTSSQYGRVALGVTGAATAVLFVAVALRLLRRARRARGATA